MPVAHPSYDDPITLSTASSIANLSFNRSDLSKTLTATMDSATNVTFSGSWNPALGVPTVPGRQNLKGSTTGTSATGTWTADNIVAVNSAYCGVPSGPVTLNNAVTGTGAGGIDTSTTVACTISVAAPAVVTQTNHGYQYGSIIQFSGTVPTGLVINTPYAALPLTANTYNVGVACVCIGTFATSVFSLTSVTSGSFVLGMTLYGTNIPYNITVSSLASGTLGVAGSTYNLSATVGTVASQSVFCIGAAITTTAGTSSATVTSMVMYGAWYYVFAIWGSGQAWTTVASSSKTNPNLPANYTYSALISAIRLQLATNYYPLAMTQYSDWVQYKQNSSSGNVPTYPIMLSGTQGTISTSTSTLVGISSYPFVPYNTSEIFLSAYIYVASNPIILISPNNTGNFGYNNVTAPAMYSYQGNTGCDTLSGAMNLETNEVFYGSNQSTAVLQCVKYKLNF